MSDRHFWQLYAWSFTAALWLYILAHELLVPALRARIARHRRRKRVRLPAPWDGAIVHNWKGPH